MSLFNRLPCTWDSFGISSIFELHILTAVKIKQLQREELKDYYALCQSLVSDDTAAVPKYLETSPSLPQPLDKCQVPLGCEVKCRVNEQLIVDEVLYNK